MWRCSRMFTAAIFVGCRGTKWNWQAADWSTGGVSACLTLLQPQWRWDRSENMLFLPSSLGSDSGNLQRGIWHFSCFSLEWDVALNSHTLGSKAAAFPPQWDRAGYRRMLVVKFFVLCFCASFCVCLWLCVSLLCLTLWLSWSLYLLDLIYLLHFSIFAFLPLDSLSCQSFVRLE